MQSVLEMESSNVCRELSRLLLVPNWALKMVRIPYLCYVYFSTIKKTSKVTSPQVLFQRKTCGFILHILMHHYANYLLISFFVCTNVLHAHNLFSMSNDISL